MTKVYGTEVYNFKRHRVAEYLVNSLSQQPIPDKPAESKSGSNLPNSITLIEIQRDRLTKIAMANQLKAGDDATSKPKKPFSSKLVKEIYETELLVKDEGKTAVTKGDDFGGELQTYGKSYENFMLSKLVPVVGNVSESDLGFEEDLADLIANDVDVIANSAANTTLDEG
ncbi:hypothetical protein F0562_017453 [Nyssa sinensis]|uniref:Fatty acyl-CoA reductase n=1 Tax=Nyssa sinensis TaxID=561372 RepID=A0A5J4ZF85_9ASTE|nr:hypothetical protein F0562_017453 [Nyssa sinensis]